MNPKNRPFMHINLGWSLWSGDHSKVKSQKYISLKNPKSLKIFCSICQPNVNGFELSIHQFKGIITPIKIRYCRPKSIHFWQQGDLGNVGCKVLEAATVLATKYEMPKTVFDRYLSQILMDLSFLCSIWKLVLSPLKWYIVTKSNWHLKRLWSKICTKIGAWHFSGTLGRNLIS